MIRLFEEDGQTLDYDVAYGLLEFRDSELTQSATIVISQKNLVLLASKIINNFTI